MDMQANRCPPAPPGSTRHEAPRANRRPLTLDGAGHDGCLLASRVGTAAARNGPACPGGNGTRPPPTRELRGRYLVEITPLILFRVRN